MDDGSQDFEQGVANPRGRKSVPWKRDPEILARLRRVERLHLRGDTNVAIAEALDVTETTIRNDLKRLAELWLEETKRDQADLRSQIVAELDDTRRRALEAAEWDQMCEAAVLFDGRSPSATDDDEDDESNAETTFRGRRGSRVHRDAKGSAQFRGNKAAALAQARQATMDKAKVLGLVVDKVAPTDKNGDDLPLTELMERFTRRQVQATEGQV